MLNKMIHYAHHALNGAHSILLIYQLLKFL